MKRIHFILTFLLSFLFLKAQYPQFSSTRNSNGFINYNNSCLTYNPEINTIAFTQRLTMNWPDSAFVSTPNPLGATGYVVTKWSTNNGSTWDSLCYYQNDIHRARFPSGVIYNPPGNTNPLNAYAVCFGPTYNGTNWDGIYFASTKLDGSLSTKPNMHTPTTNDQQWFAIDSLSIGDSIFMSPASSTVTDSAIWICARLVKNNFTNAGFAIIKGTLNNNKFDWTVNRIIKNQWVVNRFNDEYMNNNPQIAFQPNNPMVGYVLVNGVDSLASIPTLKTVYQPMVWKTIDGGISWTRVNQNYYWPNTNMGHLLFSNIRIDQPVFNNNFGGEITVDNQGYLNYVTVCEESYSSHRDSLGFSFTRGGFSFYENSCDNAFVLHFRTNGNGIWDAQYISLLYSGPMYTHDMQNPWANQTSNSLSYNNRIQITRNKMGNKLFVSWIDSDTITNNPLFDHFNTKPNLISIGYDINTQKYTQKKRKLYYNTGSDGFWWMYSSDIVIGDSSQYNLPFTFISQNGLTRNGASENKLHYVMDDTFLENDFYISPFNQFPWPFDNAGCFIINSIKQQSLYDNEEISVYPNPFTNSITIKTNDIAVSEKCKIQLLDITCKIVQEFETNIINNTYELHLNEISTGMYFIKIETQNNRGIYKIIKE